MQLVNTLIAGNSDLTPNVDVPDCASDPGGMVSQGHNLIGIVDGCNWTAAPGDVIGNSSFPVDPFLGPLADNGGDTHTHALLSGSPAIDAGHAQACLAADQRGVSRPIDGDGDGDADCDIGAFEYQIPSATDILSDLPDPSLPGEPFTVTVSVTSTIGTPTGAMTVTVSGDPATCRAALSGGLGNCMLALATPGIYTLTATYGGDGGYTSSSDSASHTVVFDGPRLYLPVIRRDD